VLFNKLEIHVRLNQWKYVYGLMDVRDETNCPNMQDVLCHSQLLGLATGNCKQSCSQATREAKVAELGALNESRHEVRCKILQARIWMMWARVTTISYYWIHALNLISFLDTKYLNRPRNMITIFDPIIHNAKIISNFCAHCYLWGWCHFIAAQCDLL
jgi:hypothetical protein